MRAKQFTRPVKEEVIDEVRMSPSAFASAAKEGSELGVLVGYEFEVCVPSDTVHDNFSSPERAAPEVSAERIAETMYEESTWDAHPPWEFTPLRFDRYFKFKEGKSKYPNMVAVYDDWRESALQKARHLIAELPEDLRNEMNVEAEKLVDSEHYESMRQAIDDDELFLAFCFGKSLYLKGSNRELERKGIDIYTVARSTYDDLFEMAFSEDPGDVVRQLYVYLDFDPETVYDAFDLSRYEPDDEEDEYDFSGYNSGYKRAAFVMKEPIADAFGADVNIFSNYHQSTKNMHDWYIEPDGSLEPNDDDEALEIVSPPMPAQAAVKAISTFYSIAERYQLYTNRSTGLHINVSIPKTLDVLKLAVFLGDQYVLKYFGRQDNSYARSMMAAMKSTISDRRKVSGASQPATAAGTSDGEGGTLATTQIDYGLLASMAKNISNQHTISISGESGKYISFRHAGGNYLKDKQGVVNVVGRFIRAMIIASDPNAYRNEYLKKVYQLLGNSINPSRNNRADALNYLREKGAPVVKIDLVTKGEAPTPEMIMTIARNTGLSDGSIAHEIAPNPGGAEAAAAAMIRVVRGANARAWVDNSEDAHWFTVALYPTEQNIDRFIRYQPTGGIQRTVAGGSTSSYYLPEKIHINYLDNKYTRMLQGQLMRAQRAARTTGGTQ
jgi:hypothetical protein